jgi:UDP:flavonoid glycosyltransferase YjiC (YdhE family)
VSRFLIVVPPMAGHVNPTLAVGAELAARGHEVAWAGHPDLVAPLLTPGCLLFPAGAGWGGSLGRAWVGLRAMAALKALWKDVLIPLAAAMVPGVEDAAEQFRPDALLVDQQAFAGAVVARRRGLPWATSASTFSELTRPYAATPKVEVWVRGLLEGLSRSFGASAWEAQRGDLRFSDDLVLAYTVPELAGPVEMPVSPVFVGPALGPRPPVPESFPWSWLDAGDPGARRDRALVSLGTHYSGAGGRFYRVLVEAVAGMADRLQVVCVARDASETLGAVPANVLVCNTVPQLELLRHVDTVVSHGGANTVTESLLNGRPLLLAPIRDDQPIVAARVASVGAGIQVRFARVGADQLAAALGTVLDDPAYAAAARRIGASLAAAGGAGAAADHLEKLVLIREGRRRP